MWILLAALPATIAYGIWNVSGDAHQAMVAFIATFIWPAAFGLRVMFKAWRTYRESPVMPVTDQNSEPDPDPVANLNRPPRT